MFGAARVATYWTGGGGGSAPVGPTWSLTGATTAYAGTARLGNEENVPTDIYFKTDGTKMFVIGSTNDRVYEYALSTAFNVFTATYTTFVSIAAQETGGSGLCFSTDGTKMFIVGATTDTVYQYTVSTAWDLSTASYASKSFSVTAQDTAPQALEFSPDGLNMYMVGQTNDTVYQYPVGTAFDVSTATTVGLKTFSVAAQMGSPFGLRIVGAGLKMYLLNNADSTVYEYALGTAYDVSTASYTTRSFQLSSIGSFDTALTGLFIPENGTKLYCSGSNLDYAWSFNFGTAYNVTTLTFNGTDSLRIGAQEGTVQSVFFRADGLRGYVFGQVSSRVYQYNLTVAWSIANMSYASIQSPSLSTQDSSGQDIAFSTDGTKMYMLGGTTDTVYQYTLSTAWNPSTATYASLSKSVAAQDTSPTGLAFKPDGLAMYIIGDGTDNIFQYTLSTAWDVSTATYASLSKSVAAQDAIPTSLTFRPDGTNVWVLGQQNDRVYQYALGTAWDISTATYSSINLSVLNVDGQATALAIADNGSRLYVAGPNLDRLVQWTLV